MKVDSEVIEIINNIPWFDNCGKLCRLDLKYGYEIIAVYVWKYVDLLNVIMVGVSINGISLPIRIDT